MDAARPDTHRLADTFKALADPARVAILAFLRAPQADCCSRGDGVCACDLEGVLGLSQPTVSHHMKLLVQAGLVRADKRGRWVYYRLDHAALDALSRDLDALHAPELELLQEIRHERRTDMNGELT
ncbi:MAG TPA: metalloregulator ArsR/SmtB family transcription factor [Trueperaceae bacterium]|nr:metalloregulator ArsR/SmtB family transcription factor [Trueperaceae bacterium]